jgi:hypothetical protein
MYLIPKYSLKDTKVFECIQMYLNVFIVYVNGISPSHSHYNVFTIHTHLHIFFSLYRKTPFPTCYTTTFFFSHSHWSIPTSIMIQSMKKLHINPYFPRLYITPHSTFYVITGCTEHSRVQVILFHKAVV